MGYVFGEENGGYLSADLRGLRRMCRGVPEGRDRDLARLLCEGQQRILSGLRPVRKGMPCRLHQRERKGKTG